VTQVPMARLGVSEEAADAIVFMASDGSLVYHRAHILTSTGVMTIS